MSFALDKDQRTITSQQVHTEVLNTPFCFGFGWPMDTSTQLIFFTLAGKAVAHPLAVIGRTTGAITAIIAISRSFSTVWIMRAPAPPSGMFATSDPEYFLHKNSFKEMVL